ncbi:DNA binding and uptake late competence protein [Niallia circulans]|uniref:ComEA protein n=1 Tax=Niallia circulans TaxID=1397 RepID=A0A0J1IN04_NIACI|nr:helix-hairpin-helix domain-containing protein [Niallia circulans]KLV27341.1 comEA protein [Niallia circulans]MDR4314315.1 comEA protein [Niallia circulans]MED3841517.1 helix-hairpin-helix domain-containing protein [Niallia circulans]MED4242471.1 helix-hairpin-helix domain-containing protein [Niallia circulans]MED4246449.1 helix-hairpin-helix domain-containing protein [Niallia circulans]
MDWLRKNKKMIFFCIGGIVLLLLYRFYPIFISSNEEEQIPQENLFAERNIEEKPEEASEEDPPVTVMLVDVKGAVKNPGVYEANDGERVNDMIEKAGGILKDGEKNAVNFAMKVTDEMIIYVPYIGEEGEAANGNAVGNETAVPSNEGTVNINKASETELLELPGVGPSKAAAIVEYREQNGGFSTKEDLKNISGIGEKTYEKLESFISIK